MRQTAGWLTGILVFLCCWGVAAESSVTEVGGGKHPGLAVDQDGRLFLVYEGLRAGNGIYVRRSDDDGHTWSAETNVSNTNGVSQDPAITVETDGAIDVAWQCQTTGADGLDIYFSRSNDGGQTWTPARNLSTAAGVSKQPAIAAGPKNSVHVVWVDESEDKGHSDILYSCSLDCGKTWTKPCNISQTPGIASQPAVAVDNDDHAHVAWLGIASGTHRFDMFYTGETGGNWSRVVNVRHSQGVSGKPNIAVDSYGTVYLCWADTSRTGKLWDICFSKSDGDEGFTRPIYFASLVDPAEPVMVLDRGDNHHLAVAWSDARDNPKARDICVVESANLGVRFTDPKRVSHTAAAVDVAARGDFMIDSYDNARQAGPKPYVALDHGKFVVGWEESEPGKSVLMVTQQSQIYPHGGSGR